MTEEMPQEKPREELIAELEETRRQLVAARKHVKELEATAIACFAAEEALRDSELKYRDMVENIHDTIYALNKDGIITYISPRIVSFLGYEPHEVIGHHFDEFLHQADLPRIQQSFRRLLAGEATTNEYRFLTKSGGIRWLRTSSQPTVDGGQIVGTHGVLFDITDRKKAEEALKRSEERYALAQRAANIGSWDWDIQTDELHWSEQIEPMFGFQPGEFASTFEAFMERVHPEDRQDVLRAVDACLKTREDYAIEHRIVWPDGSVHWVSETGNVFRDEMGKPVRMLGVVQDITQRKEAEEALRQHAVELEDRNRELDAFTYTVAHDLKNPLGLIIGYGEALAEGHEDLSPEEIDRYLQAIARSSRRMSRIIDELLLLSHLRQAEVEHDIIDMASVVEEVQQRMKDIIERDQAQVTVPERWPKALGYAPWIEEVWLNYLDNAIKYGGNPPLVEMGAEAEPNGMVRFWIRDNGPGLTAEERKQLFRPFRRLSQAQVKGHGLGLSIVRRIVRKLGGRVGVKSQPGEGSLFWFTLPGVEG